jgi:hypothetical protein
VDELREMANAHANYRFLINDEVTSEPVMLVWLLNWNSLVSTNAINEPIALKHSVKILFSKERSDVFDSWIGDPLVENLMYSNALITQLHLELMNNCQKLPPGYRKMDGFGISIF